MTTVRTVATHEVVQVAYPRPVEEGREIGRAAGKALDATLSRLSHERAQTRRIGTQALEALAAETFDDEIAAAGVEASPEERGKALAVVPGVVRAFRQSVLFGLARPRSRLLLIGGRVGVYAQPDFWDGRACVYELKTYRALPPPPDVALQLRLFQLAFPEASLSLVCLDRHVTPVATLVAVIPPPTPEETAETLRLAYRVALERGVDKVFEYIENPVLRYDLPADRAP